MNAPFLSRVLRSYQAAGRDILFTSMTPRF